MYAGDQSPYSPPHLPHFPLESKHTEHKALDIVDGYETCDTVN